MKDWRTKLAADIDSLLNVAGATTVTVTLTARQARDLANALEFVAQFNLPVSREAARVTGAVE